MIDLAFFLAFEGLDRALTIDEQKRLKMALGPRPPQDNSREEKERYRDDLAMRDADPARWNAHNGSRDINPEQARVIKKLEAKGKTRAESKQFAEKITI